MAVLIFEVVLNAMAMFNHGNVRLPLGLDRVLRLLVVTPGIRPVENRPVDDQKRTVDVAQAFANGADYIVVGRPIRDAADPRAAAESIQSTIAGHFPGP